jgi:glutathionylspermidine synthase
MKTSIKKPLFSKKGYNELTLEKENKVLERPVKMHGKDVVLHIVLRSDHDLNSSRHCGYQLLVP